MFRTGPGSCRRALNHDDSRTPPRHATDLVSWRAIMLSSLLRRTSLLAALLLTASTLTAQQKTPAPAVMPSGYLRSADWMKASTAPLAAGEIDRLVEAEW